MKHHHTFYILFLCIFVAASTAFAQTNESANEAKRIADTIAPLMNENIAIVAHADLSKINPDDIERKYKSLILSNGPNFFVDFDETKTLRKIDKLKSTANSFLRTAKTLGIQDVYFLVDVSLLPYSCGYFAVPFESREKANSFSQNFSKFVPENHFLKNHTFIDKFVVVPAPGTMPCAAAQQEKITAQISSQQTTPRPEFFTALMQCRQSLENSAAQIVVIPSKEMRRVFSEMVETLPEPLEKFPTSFLIRGMQWASLSVDLGKPEIQGVIHSENSQAAKDLRDVLEFLLRYNLDSMEHDVIYGTFLRAAEMSHEEFRDVAVKTFLPDIQNDELHLVFNEENVKTRGGKLFEVSSAISETGLSQVRRAKCTNNLKQIVLAFHNYHDVYKQLPPAWTVDKDGKPLHSWRVAVLPYLEESKLYEKIRKDEPWNSEYNRQFHKQCPRFFQCPQAVANNPDIVENGLTTYSVIIGKNAYPEGPKKYVFQMIDDGMSNTFAVVERKTPVNWMDPTQEITQENAENGINKSEHGIGAYHSGGKHFGTNMALFDGDVRFFTENLRLKVLRVFVERNDCEGYDGNNMYE